MLGCDIIKVSRIERLANSSQFLNKCFTAQERKYFEKFSKNGPTIAGHFAAKEALAKALGCGFGAQLDFLDFSITHDSKGRPLICWHPRKEASQEEVSSGKTSSIVWEGKTFQCSVSISHEKEYAMAVVILH